MKRTGGFSSDRRLTEKPDIPIDDQAIGAVYLGNHNCRFRVWAPMQEKLSLRLVDADTRLRVVGNGRARRGAGWRRGGIGEHRGNL